MNIEFQQTPDFTTNEDGVWRTTEDGSKIFIKDGEAYAGGPKGKPLTSKGKSSETKNDKLDASSWSHSKDGTTMTITKTKDGYRGDNGEFDFEATDEKSVMDKLKKWGYDTKDGASGYEKESDLDRPTEKVGGAPKSESGSNDMKAKIWGGVLTPERKERLVGQTLSVMKVRTEKVGSGSINEKKHIISFGNIPHATITESTEGQHISKGGGTEKRITVKDSKGKPIGAGFKSIPDAKRAIALARVEKMNKKYNKS